MKPILFFSRELYFFFRIDSNLVIYDASFLPFSKKFLSKIHHQTIPVSKNVSERYCLERTMLILNIKNSILLLPLNKVFTLYRETVQFFTTYNNKIYNNIIKMVNCNFLLKGDNGKMRICHSVKGAIVFYDEKEENEKEAVEMGVGMLSFYSPEEIIKEFM